MNNIWTWIIVIVFVLLIGNTFIMSQKYEELENEYLELSIEKDTTIDSLKEDNSIKSSKISELEIKILDLETNLDSLYKHKSELNKKSEFVVSKNLSEGVKLLKENLSWIN